MRAAGGKTSYRRDTVVTALEPPSTLKEVKFFPLYSKLNFEPPYNHIEAKRAADELKNTSEDRPSHRDRNPKISLITPFSFFVSLDFFTIVFLVLF